MNNEDQVHFTPPRKDLIGSNESSSVKKYLSYRRDLKIREKHAVDEICLIFKSNLKGYQSPYPGINIKEMLRIILAEVCVEDIEEGIAIFNERGIKSCINYFIDLV